MGIFGVNAQGFGKMFAGTIQSTAEADFIIAAAKEGMRTDGRKFNDFRNVRAAECVGGCACFVVRTGQSLCAAWCR